MFDLRPQVPGIKAFPFFQHPMDKGKRRLSEVYQINSFLFEDILKLANESKEPIQIQILLREDGHI